MTENVELVRRFLRAQNLEQIGNVDDAVGLYESVIAERFDSSGPYDRLIFLYSEGARHRDVVRVAEAAVAHVQTYEEKVAWYERMRADALAAEEGLPKAAPKRR